MKIEYVLSQENFIATGVTEMSISSIKCSQ